MDEAEARERIHNLLLAGDNRLKQGVAAEKIRASYEEALQVAREAGLVEDGYRLLANTGINAGQEVPHLHVHIFGGRQLGPMLAR